MSFGTTVTFAIERIVDPVEGMHRAISGRWFSAVGRVGKPVQLAHDAVSGTVYQSIRLASVAVGAGLDMATNVRPEVSDGVQAFTNGLWGDRLGRYEDRLGISMGLRDRNGQPIEVGPQLASAFPAATGHLVVLVHGLVNTERAWQGAEAERSVLEALETDADLTPISVRYNSGRPVPDNGQQLATLLEGVHREWPVPVQSMSLVGHSMGGLVIRSACSIAHDFEHAWISDVSDVVTLGAPHLGAPLEKLTNVVAWGLNRTEETRPLAEFLNNRSRGIKDLRFGVTTEDDWGDIDADALLVNSVIGYELPQHIKHHFVAGVITSDPSHPAGAAMGDLIVRADSAAGGERLEPADVVVVGGVRHADLTREPAVVDQVMDWLTP